MAIVKLEKEVWHPYFDAVSKVMSGKRAEVAVDSLRLGHQVQAEWVPIFGIVYDPKSDIVEVAMEGLDHMIPHPHEVYVDVAAGGQLTSVEVIDEDDERQIISLRDPLMLPAPLH